MAFKRDIKRDIRDKSGALVDVEDPSDPAPKKGFKRDSQLNWLQRLHKVMQEGGANVANSAMHPLQAGQDLLRTSSNFVTLGGDDWLQSLWHGTPIEAERQLTRDADTRLGSIDDALTVAASVYQPSVAGKYMPAGASALTKALGHGSEQAGIAGTQALIQGEDPLIPMAVGGATGAGGSAVTDVTTGFANRRAQGKPEFKTDQALFDAADKAKGNVKSGKDLKRRAEIVEQARLANAEGKQGFQNMLAAVKGYGRAESGLTREAMEQLTRLANNKGIGSKIVHGLGTAISGGNSWGKLPVAMLSKGILPGIGAGLHTAADIMAQRIPPKQADKFNAIFRRGATGAPAYDEQTIEMMRAALTKMAATGGREQQ